MSESAITIRKPFFFLLTGAIFLLVILLGLLFTERNSFQAENRYLILKNDSIMSVNILLADSLKQQSTETSKPRTVSYK